MYSAHACAAFLLFSYPPRLPRRLRLSPRARAPNRKRPARARRCRARVRHTSFFFSFSPRAHGAGAEEKRACEQIDDSACVQRGSRSRWLLFFSEIQYFFKRVLKSRRDVCAPTLFTRAMRSVCGVSCGGGGRRYVFFGALVGLSPKKRGNSSVFNRGGLGFNRTMMIMSVCVCFFTRSHVGKIWTKREYRICPKDAAFLLQSVRARISNRWVADRIREV